MPRARRRQTSGLAEAHFDHYTSFGENPSVIGTPPVEFSAWTFARQEAARMAAQEQAQDP
jgi:hypothetical protein